MQIIKCMLYNGHLFFISDYVFIILITIQHRRTVVRSLCGHLSIFISSQHAVFRVTTVLPDHFIWTPLGPKWQVYKSHFSTLAYLSLLTLPVFGPGNRAVGGNDENGDWEGDSPYFFRCHYLHLSTIRHNSKWSGAQRGPVGVANDDGGYEGKPSPRLTVRCADVRWTSGTVIYKGPRDIAIIMCRLVETCN